MPGQMVGVMNLGIAHRLQSECRASAEVEMIAAVEIVQRHRALMVAPGHPV